MSKHTPGPWKVGNSIEQRNGPREATVVAADGVRVVARLHFNRMPDDPAEANAALIAAAPELLEALKELSDLFDAWKAGEYLPDSFTTQPARAAIAKAES